MLEAYGDIWEIGYEWFHQGKDVGITITTNGFYRKDGKAVMGRGVAKEAAERFPWLPINLGSHLKYNGNIPVWYGADFNPDTGGSIVILTFPVKPQYGPRGEMGWKAKADLNLIKESADYLASQAWQIPNNILVPRPGCGNGGLKWEQVKPVIEPILDDRFTVVTWHP